MLASKRRPLGRVEQTMDTECIKLAGRDVGNKYMPVVIGAMRSWIECDHARGPCVIHPIEQAQFHARAVLGEHAEIGAAIAEPGAKWETATLGDGLVHLCPLSPRTGGYQIGEDQRVVLAHATGGDLVIPSLKTREHRGLIATRNKPQDVAGMIEHGICQRHTSAALVFTSQRDRVSVT